MSTFGLLRHIPGAFVVGNQIKHGGRELNLAAFGTRLWNCLHPDWRKLTKRAFKRKIHKLLLTVLEIEDYYVDAHSLILNFKNTRIELS